MSVIWSGVTEEGAVVPVQVTAEGKVVAVGDGPEGDYLKLTGGNLTGDLTINTDKITLDAGDGSIDAAGNISIPQGKDFVCSDATQSYFRPRSDNSILGYQETLDIQAFNEGSPLVAATFASNGSASFAGDVKIGGTLPSAPNIALNADGLLNTQRIAASSTPIARFKGIEADGTEKGRIEFFGAGSANFAGGKCGFTSDGELIFSSRGTKYKLFVSQGVCQAEEYTRQMELKEKTEQFIADKRETKPSDPSDPSDSQSEVSMDNDNA